MIRRALRKWLGMDEDLALIVDVLSKMDVRLNERIDELRHDQDRQGLRVEGRQDRAAGARGEERKRPHPPAHEQAHEMREPR
jgi:hypothetical protein